MRVRTAHHVVVPLPPGELWCDVIDVARYETWWPWIRVNGASELREGSHVSVAIPSPLGYRVRITLAPTEVAPERRLEAAVTGDLRGTGTLSMRDDGAAQTRLELAWEVEVVRPLLRALGWLARPILEWGHRRVMARAIDDFLHRR